MKDSIVAYQIEGTPLLEIGEFLHNEDGFVEKHYHDYDEYWYFTQGEAIIMNEGKTRTVKKGDLVYTRRGNNHALLKIKLAPVKGIYFSNNPVNNSQKIAHLHERYNAENILVYAGSGSGKKDYLQDYLLGLEEDILIFDLKNEFDVGNIIDSVEKSDKGLYRIVPQNKDMQNSLLKRIVGKKVVLLYDLRKDDQTIRFIKDMVKNDITFILSTEDRDVLSIFNKTGIFRIIEL